MGEYSVHQLKPEDFDILIPLMKDCFGMSVNVEYFRWKFLQNPAGPVIGFYALSDTGECAAYYGAIAENYILNGQARKIYQSCDTMTHSKHRRKGLFQKLATTCYDYLEKQDALFIIGFGGGQSTPGFLKFGWRHAFDAFFHLKPKFICWPQIGLYQISHLFSKGRYQVEELAGPEPILDLIQQSNSRTTIALDKSLAFIQWKLKNPLHAVKIIAVKKDGNYVAYAMYHIDANKIMLLDAFCKSNSGSADSLFNGLNRIVVGNGLGGIVTFAQRQTAFSKLLLSNGFMINTFNFGPLHEHLPFIFYASKTEMDTYNYPQHWSITALDHDAF